MALGFGERIRRALLEHASQIGRRYSNREFAEDVGRAETGQPYSSSAVTEWIAERSEPGIATFKAMARILNKPVAYLMALDVPAAEPAEQPPDAREYRTLTAEQIARAERKAERERRESKERARNAGGARHPRGKS